MQTGRCRANGCRRPIRWVVTLAGARMPIDPEPVPDGNVLIVETDRAAAYFETEIGRAVTLPAADLDRARRAGRDLYVSHWATCPERAKVRAETDARRAGA